MSISFGLLYLHSVLVLSLSFLTLLASSLLSFFQYILSSTCPDLTMFFICSVQCCLFWILGRRFHCEGGNLIGPRNVSGWSPPPQSKASICLPPLSLSPWPLLFQGRGRAKAAGRGQCSGRCVCVRLLLGEGVLVIFVAENAV